MRLVPHEAQDLKELTMGCVNTITNMAYFRSHAKDAELKAMLERHWSAHIQDYNIKVQYLTQPNGSNTKLQMPDLNVTLRSLSESASSNYSSATPRTSLTELNDREMATSYLLTLKRSGREYAWAAMEASHPEIRLFLEDAFRMACRHAFDIWQWMVKKGYYPVDTMVTHDQTSEQLFQVVQDPSVGTMLM